MPCCRVVDLNEVEGRKFGWVADIDMGWPFVLVNKKLASILIGYIKLYCHEVCALGALNLTFEPQSLLLFLVHMTSVVSIIQDVNSRHLLGH